MRKTIIYTTDCQCYTEEQAEKHFRNKLSMLNYPILKAHLTDPLFAMLINGFAEQNGVLFLMIGDEMVSVTNNFSYPAFSN